MAWKIEFLPRALRALKKLDPPTRRAILDALAEISELSNPTSRGKPLSGNLRGLWRYRVGNYRVICSIEHDELVILAMDLGHRSTIYR